MLLELPDAELAAGLPKEVVAVLRPRARAEGGGGGAASGRARGA